MVSDCCSKRCHERGLVIACWFVAVLGLLVEGCLLRGRMLLAWVWAPHRDGGGWRGRGLRRAAQLTSVGGSPQREISGGGVPVSLELSVPQLEDTAVGIAGIVCGRRRAPVISKVELDHPHLVLMRMHPMSFPLPNQHGILSASPVSTRT